MGIAAGAQFPDPPGGRDVPGKRRAPGDRLRTDRRRATAAAGNTDLRIGASRLAAEKFSVAAENETADAKPVASRLPLLPGGSVRKSSDRFLQFFGCAECDLLARLDLNLLAGRRIAANARGALAHLKNTEPADADALAFL